MKKNIFASSLLCVLFLIAGTFLFPSSMIMSLASTSIAATAIRIVLASVLVAVLVTSPPRAIALRVALAITAVALLLLGVSMSFGNGMHLLDAVLYLQLGCVLGIEALEYNDDELEKDTEHFHELYQIQTHYPAAQNP